MKDYRPEIVCVRLISLLGIGPEPEHTKGGKVKILEITFNLRSKIVYNLF